MVPLLLNCGESTPTSSPPALAEPTQIPVSDAQAVVHMDAASVDPNQFVDLQSLVPEVLLDMRYASENNFTHKKVYPKARCLLRAPVAKALRRVQDRLRTQQLQLWIWDCYRPFHVQEEFWKLVPNPKYVAKPIRRGKTPWRGSKHNRGAAVDLSLADTSGTQLVMPTNHDDFSERAHRDAEGIPMAVAARARILDEAMRAEGFQGIESEWWHYDYAGWQDYELSDESL